MGKLNTLKSSYLNQKYDLEALVLRKYPQTIQELTERMAGYEKDIEIVAANPKSSEAFPGMEIFGTVHAEKEDAGKAMIDACARMTGSEAVPIGQYRGFPMALSFESTFSQYHLTLKGALSHTVTLGADVYGNITRVDNLLEGFGETLETVQANLADTKVQLENARAEMAAPFPKAAERQEKSAKLNSINILLNLDEKDKTMMDTEPEADLDRPRKPPDRER